MKGQRPINNQVVMDYYFSILRENTKLARIQPSFVRNTFYVFGIGFMYSYFLELFRPLTKWVTAVVVVLVSKPLQSTTKHAVWHKYFKAYYTESLRHQRI